MGCNSIEEDTLRSLHSILTLEKGKNYFAQKLINVKRKTILVVIILIFLFFNYLPWGIAHPCNEPHTAETMTPKNIARCHAQVQKERLDFLSMKLQAEERYQRAKATNNVQFMGKALDAVREAEEALELSGWPKQISASDVKEYGSFLQSRLVSVSSDLEKARENLKKLNENYDRLRQNFDRMQESELRQMENLSKQLDRDSLQLLKDSALGFIKGVGRNAAEDLKILEKHPGGVIDTTEKIRRARLIKNFADGIRLADITIKATTAKSDLERLNLAMKEALTEIGKYLADQIKSPYKVFEPVAATEAKRRITAYSFFLTESLDVAAIVQTLRQFGQTEERLYSTLDIRKRWDLQIGQVVGEVQVLKSQKNMIEEQMARHNQFEAQLK